MHRLSWLCPFLGLVLAAAILMLWGLSLWTAIVAALVLACPIVMLWGWVTAGRAARALEEPIPSTRGMTLNWAAPFYDWYCPRM